MLGSIIVYMILGLSLVSTVSYFLSIKYERLSKVGEIFYFAVVAGIVFISAYLLSNIFNHNFQLTYVWEYSSKELPTLLLFSSFYSGQEGSFLLWALMLSLLGLIVQPFAKRNGYQAYAMGFYSLILVFITLMLIAKSPFNFVWETFADQGIQKGFMPPSGRGLNPILQNYWNAIHPPILFIGYAAMTVPFVFAITGLIKRDYHNWIKIAVPWTLAATGILGLGIMLGGFWAYETLGWGGFWGWDPVENSSLLPWLTAVALVHTMLVQRKTNGLIRTNFVLAIISFVLVLYATFLTRSGVLGEMSVHSFGEPGKFVYSLLLAFLLIFLGLGILFLLIRMKDISSFASKFNFKLSSREFMLSIGSLIILAITIIVFMGTSWPLFAELLGKTKSSVEIQFYNNWTLPFAIVILLLNALSLYLAWNKSEWDKTFKRTSISALIALAASLFLFSQGVNQIPYLILVFASFYSVAVNIEFIVRYGIRNPASIGAMLSHTGISLLLLGALASSVYSMNQHVTLALGSTHKVFGINVTFKEKIRVEKELQDREKYVFLIEAEKDGEKIQLKPIFYWSDFNSRQAPFLEPGIHEKLFADFYISPKEAHTVSSAPTMLLAKGETYNLPGDSSIKVTLNAFDMSKGMELTPDNKVLLGAVVDIAFADGKVVNDTLFTKIDMQSMIGNPVMKKIEGTKFNIGFNELVTGDMMAGTSQAAIVVTNDDNPMPEEKEVFTFDFSIKPFINLVWFGTILTVLGFFIAIFRYKRGSKQTVQE